MTIGETRLREDILRSLLDIDAIGDPDQLLDYVDAVISALKKEDYFVHCGSISEVTWDNIADFQDDGVVWSIKTEDYFDEEEDDVRV